MHIDWKYGIRARIELSGWVFSWWTLHPEYGLHHEGRGGKLYTPWILQIWFKNNLVCLELFPLPLEWYSDSAWKLLMEMWRERTVHNFTTPWILGERGFFPGELSKHPGVAALRRPESWCRFKAFVGYVKGLERWLSVLRACTVSAVDQRSVPSTCVRHNALWFQFQGIWSPLLLPTHLHSYTYTHTGTCA